MRTLLVARLRWAVGAVATGCLTAAVAHPIAVLEDVVASPQWPSEPWVVFWILASVTLYALGLARLWRHAGTGRGVSGRQASSFAGGTTALWVALLTPLDDLSSRLFSAHMVQHELLMLIAAPLLVLGRPLACWTWALPLAWRRRIGRVLHRPAWRVPWLFLTSPLVAWLSHALALWTWHLPALFDAALNDPAVHAIQHLSFLLTALVFWWSVLGAVTRREQGVALVSLFTTMVHSGALGALLTLASAPWYPHYISTASADFHLNALEDQELGGLIMWVPAGAVYILCGLALAIRWMQPTARSRLAEQAPLIHRRGSCPR